MHQYGVADVEKLLRLPRSTIRALVAAGFVAPARGPRNRWQFSFQDLIVLRTAQALANADVPPQRITRSLKELRRQLPETMPLSGLSIRAVGSHVVVKDAAGDRQADSGQYLLAFEGDPERGALSVIERPAAAAPPAMEAEACMRRALALEETDVDAALQAYDQALAADPQRVDARINRGRLLHEHGRLREAEAEYRSALALGADDPVLHYNLGVLLGDLGRAAEAMAAYQAALRSDPGLADGYYNLALLCETLDKPQDAIRHMSQYRRLVAAQAE